MLRLQQADEGLEVHRSSPDGGESSVDRKKTTGEDDDSPVVTRERRERSELPFVDLDETSSRDASTIEERGMLKASGLLDADIEVALQTRAVSFKRERRTSNGFLTCMSQTNSHLIEP